MGSHWLGVLGFPFGGPTAGGLGGLGAQCWRSHWLGGWGSLCYQCWGAARVEWGFHLCGKDPYILDGGPYAWMEVPSTV